MRTTLLVALSVLLAAPAVARKKGEDLETRLARLEAALKERPRDVSRFKLPQRLEFCGQEVDLDDPDLRQRIEKELLLVLGNRAQVVLWARRAAGVFPIIEAEAKRIDACTDLKYVAVIESGLRPGVESHASAKGWWQFLAGTGRQYGLHVDRVWDERADLSSATGAGLKYLTYLKGKFGTWPLAMAAYNTGPGRLARAMKAQQQKDFWALDLYTEAERYVPRVLAIKSVLSDPEAYDFRLDPADAWGRPAVGYVKVKVPKRRTVSVLDLAVGSGVGLRRLRALNPELVTDQLPSGVEVVLEVPQGKERKLRGWLASELARQSRVASTAPAARKPKKGRKARKKAKKRRRSKKGIAKAVGQKKKRAKKKARSKRYTIRSGDSLWSVAQRNKVSVAELRKWNRLGRKAVLQPGQRIVVKR